MLQRDKKTSELPPVFSDGGETFSNPINIAQKFNSFFVNIGQELPNKMSVSPGNPLDFIQRSFPVMSYTDSTPKCIHYYLG